MNALDADTLKTAYLSGCGVVTALLVWSGWRQGAARQGMSLLAVAGAYAVGFFGRKMARPLFDFLGYPDFITEIIGGFAAGLLTYITVYGLSRVFFKPTRGIADRVSRIRSGTFGSVLGLVFAALILVLCFYAVRMMGTIASSKIHVIQAEQAAHKQNPSAPIPEEPGALIKGLAMLNDALNEGQTGEILHSVDHIPPNVYAMLFKLGIMASSEEAMSRFLDYPGVSALANEPRLKALTKDPAIAELLISKSYLRLLRNEKVVALANDSDFAARLRAMDFDKAMDHAIKGDNPPPLEKPTPQSLP
jgi:uncharacterized membrane protein required for colicin V production